MPDEIALLSSTVETVFQSLAYGETDICLKGLNYSCCLCLHYRAICHTRHRVDAAAGVSVLIHIGFTQPLPSTRQQQARMEIPSERHHAVHDLVNAHLVIVGMDNERRVHHIADHSVEICGGERTSRAGPVDHCGQNQRALLLFSTHRLN